MEVLQFFLLFFSALGHALALHTKHEQGGGLKKMRTHLNGSGEEGLKIIGRKGKGMEWKGRERKKRKY